MLRLQCSTHKPLLERRKINERIQNRLCLCVFVNIKMEKTTKNMKTGDKSIEERYFLCSFPPDAELFAICVRRHWHVENLLHWVLDVAFRQDYLRTKNKTAMNNLGHVQRFVLSILKILKSYYRNKSFKRMREHIGRKFNEQLPVIFSALKILYDKGRFNS